MNKMARAGFPFLLSIAIHLPANATGFFEFGAGDLLTFRDCVGVPADVNCAQAVGSFSVTLNGGVSSDS